MKDTRVLAGFLRWTEVDRTPVTVPARRGFGTSVINCVISAEKGESRYNWHVDGLAREISIEALTNQSIDIIVKY